MTYLSEVLADSPNGLWKLGESSGNPQDSSGNAKHITVVGGTPTYGVAGPIAGTDAITLDGSTEYFTTPDDALFDLGDVFTLEGWVNSAAEPLTIVCKGSGAYQLRIVVPGDSGTARALELVRTGVAEIVESTADVPATGWHHCVATKSGATVKLYIDGADVTGTVTNSTFANSADVLTIGATNTPGEFFNGSLGWVAVYPTALSASRVLAHYTAASSGLSTSPRLDAKWYDFDRRGFVWTHFWQDTGATGPVNRTLSDSLALADTVARQGTFLRTAADSLALANAVARVMALARTATDSVAMGNTVTRVGAFTRTAADSLSMGNTVTRAFAGSRILADSITIGDSVSRVGTFLRSVADALAIADAVTQTKVITRTIADALSLGDVVTRSGAFIRTAADSLAIGNTVARIVTLARTAADALGFSDAVDAVKSGTVSRTVADALNIADTVARTGAFLRSAADSLSLGNAVSRVVAAARSATDALSVGNTVSRILAASRTAADSLTVADAVTRAIAFTRTAADTLTIVTSVVASTGVVIVGGITHVLARAYHLITRSSAVAATPSGSAAGQAPSGDVAGDTPNGRASEDKPR